MGGRGGDFCSDSSVVSYRPAHSTRFGGRRQHRRGAGKGQIGSLQQWAVTSENYSWIEKQVHLWISYNWKLINPFLVYRKFIVQTVDQKTQRNDLGTVIIVCLGIEDFTNIGLEECGMHWIQAPETTFSEDGNEVSGSIATGNILKMWVMLGSVVPAYEDEGTTIVQNTEN